MLKPECSTTSPMLITYLVPYNLFQCSNACWYCH